MTGNGNTLYLPNENDLSLMVSMNDAPGTGWGVPFTSAMAPSPTFSHPATYTFHMAQLYPRVGTTYSFVAWVWIEDPATAGTVFTLEGYSDNDGCNAKCVPALWRSQLALTQALLHSFAAPGLRSVSMATASICATSTPSAH